MPTVVQNQGKAVIDAWQMTVPITSTAGNTLVLVIGSNIQATSWVMSHVKDDANNHWQQLTSVQAGTMGVQGACGMSVWVCYYARAVTRVTASWNGFRDAVGMAAQVFEVSGLVNVNGLDTTGTTSTSGTSITPSATTASSNDFCLAAIFQGTIATTVSHTADAWTTVAEVSNFNTTGAALDVDDSSRLNCAYLMTGGAGGISTTWTISGSTVSAGVIIALKGGSATTTNPNPLWPQLTTKTAFGQPPNAPGVDGSYTYSTDISQYVRSASCSFGVPYELSTTQAGQQSLELYNQDGRFDHSNTGSPYSPNVLDYVPVQQIATWNGVQYGIFTGYVERWPQMWDEVLTGLSPVTVVDAWATFGKKKMLSCMQHEVLLDTPWGYWPLNDSSRSVFAANLASGSASGVVLYTTAPQHATDATADFGASTKLLGDAGTAWGQTAPTPKNDAGWTLYTRVTGATFPSTTGGVTFEMWAEVPWVPQRNDEMTLFALKSASVTWADHHLISLQVSQTPTSIGGTTSNLLLNTYDNTGLATQHDIGTQPLCDGRWHHFVVSFTGTNATVYVDGKQVANITINLATTQIDTIDVGGEQDDWVSRDIGVGTYAHVAVYTGYLSANSISSHFASGHDGFPEDSGSRINRLLTYAGWNGPRALEQGNSILGPCITIENQFLSDALNDVALWEYGLVYADQLGRIVFLNRQNRWSQTSKGVLGDGPGEIPYEGDIKIDYDPTLVYNDIEIQRTTADGSTGALSVSGDPNNTAAQYFFQSLQLNLMLLSDTQIAERVTFLYALLSVPLVRLEALTFTPSSNPATFATVLGFNVGDRYTVKRRPLGRTDTISLDVIISEISHDIAPGRWQVKVSTLPALTNSTTGGVGPWQLDDVNLSVLGTSTALGV